MIVSISEAARLSGKSRTTLYRLLNSGELSSVTGVDSQPGIDISELLRVFPGIRVQVGVQNERPPVTPSEQCVTPEMDSHLYRSLQAQIDALERLLTEKDQRIMLLEDLRQATPPAPPQPLPAAAPATPEPAPPRRRRGFLDRLADGLTAALK
jgi:hypothetical protein